MLVRVFSFSFLFFAGPKSNVGIPTRFEPFLGTKNIALGKRLPGSPPDWPAPDRTLVKKKGSRYTSRRLIKLDFTYFYFQVCF